MIIKKKLLIIIGILILLNIRPVLSDVLINEFVVDPQNNWGDNGGVTVIDEWFELYNNGTTDINITGWNVSLIDTTNATEVLSGVILAGGYFTILNPSGDQLNNGMIILSNSSIIDQVTYGTYDDGNTSDNAPDGNANDRTDECLSRKFDTNNDSYDFIKARCTYNSTNDFEPPTLTWITPQNNVFITGLYNITVNITDTVSSVNSSLVNFNSTNYTMSNNEYYLWNTSKNTDGSYNITIYYNDSLGYSNTTTLTNITVDNTNPSVSLNAPLNNTWANDGVINFIYTPSDTNIDSCALYHNASGWSINQTNSSVNSNQQDNITLSFNDGNYLWNVWCNDSAGNSAFNANYTINVDTTFPSIAFASGANNSYFSRDWIYVDITLTETNENTTTFYLYNSSIGLINTTILNPGSRNINFTNLNPNMEYYYNVYARDKANNVNSTELRKLTLDSTSPVVSYAGGTENNAAFFNRDWIYVNVSITETNFNNMTFYLYNSTSQLNASNFTALTNAVNFTELNSNEYYYYNVTLRDKAGNVNSAETRNITLDSTPPSVTLNSPVNVNWSTAVMPTILNASVTDTNIQTVIFNVSNASSYLTYNANNNWLNASFDTRDLAEGQHNVTVYAWDYAGNLNSSEYAIFNVDNYGPNFFLNKTPALSYNNDTVTLNATINDTLASVSTVWLSGNWSGAWENITLQGYSFTIGSNNFTNQQTIGYQWFANDSLGNIAQSALQTFTVQNRAPTLNSTIPNQTFIEDAPAFTINLSTYFIDADGNDPQALSYTSAITSNITITITNNIATIDSNEDWCGIETVNFTANDSLNTTPSNQITLNATCQNDAPTNEGMPPVPDVTFNEDSYNGTLLISDYIYDKDSAIVEYSSYSNDSNLMITILSANYSYINATENWNGQAEVYFKARDLEGQWGNSNTFTVNVSPVNDAPYTNTTPSQLNITESDSQASLSLTPYFADIENTSLSYTVTSENETELNCTISGASLVYKPRQYWHGTSACNITANDTELVSPAQIFTFLVNSTENIPVITTTCAAQTNQSEFYTCDINATDGDVINGEQTLTFSLTEKPGTMVIDAGTGIISWIPDDSYVGSNNIEVKAQDSQMNYDTYSFTINVIDKDDEPSKVALTSPANDSTIVSATKIAKLDWQNSTDPENQSITYYIFFGNQTTQSLLTTTSASEYTTSILNDNSTYYWYIIAGDGTLNSTSSETWQFNTLFDNAPVILDTEPVADPSITETESILFNATLYDMDQNNIYYNWSIDGITNSTGTTSSYNETVSLNFTSGYNSSANSPYAIKLEIKDVNNNTGLSKSWVVTVTNNNRAPVLGSITGKSIDEDSTLSFNITASDPDLDYGDSLTYSSNLTQISIQKINNTFASVSWTPTNSYIGNNTINFTVTDGTLSDSQTIIITVANTNDAPILNPIGSLTAYEDTVFTYDVNAADSDTGDNITFYDNTTLFNISSSTGIINFIPTENDVGIHYINITAKDALNASDSEIITLTISNTNDAPILNPIANYSVLEDSTISFGITASDLDLDYGDSLSYSSNLTQLSIQKINNTFASISWTPVNDDVGSNTINFTVTDNSGLSSSQIAIITVNNTNDAPNISSYYPMFNPAIADYTGAQLFNITKADIDNDALTVKWTISDIEVSNNDYYTASNLSPGTYTVKVVLNDSTSYVARSWALTVSELPISNKYAGTFRLLNKSQLDNATNITIESSEGKIDFGNTTLNLSDVVDFDNYINISKGVIGIDTTKFPALNKPAEIILGGLGYLTTPIVYYNSGFGVTGSTVCPSYICTDIVYNQTFGRLTFNVNGFSTYWVGTINSAPVITSSAVTSAILNQVYSYGVDASDVDGDTLTYSLTSYPSGMSINNNTGLITWTPSSLGSFNVVASVSDTILTSTQSFTIIVSEAERAKLVIKDLDVKVGGKKDSNLEAGDKIDEPAQPGSSVDFILKIENLYTDEEDMKFDNVEVEIIIEDIDDGDDLEDETEEFDLDPEEDKKETISFDIPLEVDEGDYTVRVKVKGEDENNTYHRIEWRLTLEVEKDKHEVIIKDTSLNPSIITCDKDIGFGVEIINIGEKDEDDVSIEITNTQLELDLKETGIELDEDPDHDDNSFKKTFYATLPEKLSEGTYPITYKVYYDDKLSDTEREDLIIKGCKQVKKGSAVKEVDLVSRPTYSSSSGVAVAQPVTEGTSIISFGEQDDFMLLLSAVLVFLSVIVLIFVIIKMLIIRR
tara:strand:- start:414 stop:7118 length:6705 start_codon:yes stop_codon:yes gene_type:complete